MTAAVSPKLMTILMLAVAVAAFGGWRLLSDDGAPTETGFEPGSGLPIVDEAEQDDLERVPDEDGPIGRNPFERGDRDPTVELEDGSSTTSTPVDTVPTTIPTPVTTQPPANTPPVFPNPDLVDQEPPVDDRRSAGDDSSFDG